jgi:hypothetical protein
MVSAFLYYLITVYSSSYAKFLWLTEHKCAV